ncbi:PAS domain-containing protein [Nostoc sp. FACHB-145]|uniref:hybrid sensor histidine kinase/response regulator n=1 Tax=Nostoc sp. FACHB-145 TaxID=2692836 RepID=UPI0016856EF7|nr:PAS domain-containing protein [Nostoc sp. FACHB-145]MBD2470653.1 PAS domain-containing protein [Nostoc sp. FACHB-145]
MTSLHLTKNLQESLQQSEESFRLLVESVQDYAIFMLNPDGYIVSWNIGAERIKGYHSEEIIGQHFSCFYPPEDIEQGKPQQELKVAQNCGRVEDEGWRLRKDGSRFWANVIITALRDNDGNLQGFAKVTRDMTERKMAEELRTSHFLVNSVLEGITDAVFVKDIQSQYLLINSAGANFIGKPVAEIIGKDDTKLVAPDSALKIIANDRQILSSGASLTYEETVTADNITRTYLTTKTPYRDEDGNTLGLLGISRDISEQQAALRERKRVEAEKAEILAREQAARKQADESLALLDTLLNSAPVGLAFFDRELRCLRMNEYIAGINGVSLEQSIGRRMKEYLPEFADQVEALMCQVLETGEPIKNLEITGETKAGDRGEQHALANYYPVYAKDGEILGIGIAVSDITEIKRTEKKLRERTAALSEHTQRLQLLSETTSELLSSEQPLALIKNLFAKIQPLGLDVYFNYLVDEEKQMLRLASYGGISEEQAKRIEWLEFSQGICGAVTIQGSQISVANILQGTDPKTDFLRSIGIQTFSCQPLRVQGQVKGTLSFGSRSRSSLTTEEIAWLQTICDQIAIAIHRSELMASLQRQTEQLQQANRMKDEFLAIVSHELRSPLNAILGWSTILRKNSINDATKATAVETIERNARLQTQLIEDLLDVSRIITGKLKLNMQSLQIAAIVQAAIESVRPAADAKQIQLQSLVDPTVGTVRGDSGRLQQVIWNLLSNAVKFTHTGGRIQVRLDRVNSNVQVTVSDTGIGIEPEFLPFVFERFRQADATTTRAYGGLGLGLAIVSHIVKLHSGTVCVESPGKEQGATFIVNLPSETPVLFSARVPDGGVSFNSSDTFASLPTLVGLKVLVVDDEADTRDYQAMVLSANGAIVKAVASAAEALEVVRQWQPDVLLSDIGMPLEDGYSLIRKIRDLPPHSGGQIPAAALTAYAKDEERQQALSSGFQRHLSKPVEPSELVKVVASLTTKLLNT